MSSAATQAVDCSDTNQDARESFECTNSDAVRDQITTAHFFVMFGVLFLSFVIIQITLQVSKRMKTKRMRHIPPEELPLTRDHLSKKMYKLVVMSQFDRSGGAEHVQPEVNLSHTGWAYPRTHFKTSIAHSNSILEEACKSLGDKYTRKPHQSVREFVERLKMLRIPLQQVPGAPQADGMTFDEACDYYTRVYEEAKYGRREFTQEEYDDFLLRCYRLVLSIKT